MQTTDDCPVICTSFRGEIDNHYPTNNLLHFSKVHPYVFPVRTHSKPLQEAHLVLTDGSSTGMAALVIGNQTFTFKTPYKSAKLVDFFAIIQVFFLNYLMMLLMCILIVLMLLFRFPYWRLSPLLPLPMPPHLSKNYKI